LHQTAAVVVLHGGYNSVLEAASGGARILVHHLENYDPENDERIRFERRLSEYYPVTAVRSLEHLTADIRREVQASRSHGRAEFELDREALPRIRELLESDLTRARANAQNTNG
jgi:hypothetical protein